MDLWGQLIGKKEQTLVVVDGEDWHEVPPSRALDRSLAKRATKEGWTDSEGGHEFHVLLTRSDSRDTTTRDILVEIVVGGILAERLGPDRAGRAIEQMRTNGAFATAAQATARVDAEGRWTVRVLL